MFQKSFQKYSTLFVLFFLLSAVKLASAQSSNEVCVCCPFAFENLSADNEIGLAKVFPSAIIKKHHYKEVIVYTVPRNDKDTLIPPYKEFKLRFDAQGFVSSKMQYYLGQPGSVNEYERNAAGKVMSNTISHLDSTEQKMGLPTYTLYTYDDLNRLIKVEHGEDAKTVSTTEPVTEYKYDKMNRLVEKIIPYSSDYKDKLQGLHSMVISTKYSDSLTSESAYVYNKKPHGTWKTTYNSKWQPLTIMHHDTSGYQRRYTYDSSGRLKTFESKGTGSECPDNGTFTNLFFYNEEGLLTRIEHRYGKYVCEMKFEYSN